MRYALALDLKDDPALIAEYERYHERIWPEIERSIQESGITNMEIYRVGNRLFMLMETDETFSFERKAAADAANPKVEEWEALMWQYQQALPITERGESTAPAGTPERDRPGEKWVLMKKIFAL